MHSKWQYKLLYLFVNPRADFVLLFSFAKERILLISADSFLHHILKRKFKVPFSTNDTNG